MRSWQSIRHRRCTDLFIRLIETLEVHTPWQLPKSPSALAQKKGRQLETSADPGMPRHRPMNIDAGTGEATARCSGVIGTIPRRRGPPAISLCPMHSPVAHRPHMLHPHRPRLAPTASDSTSTVVVDDPSPLRRLPQPICACTTNISLSVLWTVDSWRRSTSSARRLQLYQQPPAAHGLQLLRSDCTTPPNAPSPPQTHCRD